MHTNRRIAYCVIAILVGMAINIIGVTLIPGAGKDSSISMTLMVLGSVSIFYGAKYLHDSDEHMACSASASGAMTLSLLIGVFVKLSMTPI